MARNRWLSVRLDPEDSEAVRREARALHLTDSAYVRLLIQRGRDRMFLQHLANELKDLQAPEMREALYLVLSATAETKALVRASTIKTLGVEAVRHEQNQVVPGVQNWRLKLKVPDRTGP
jgi:hypothetical protein